MTRSFEPLPRDRDRDGQPRRTGVEIEFSGLEAEDVAAIAVDRLGGQAEQVDSHAWQVKDSRIGRLDIYLDTALRHAENSVLKRIGLDLGKEVIPVEIVTQPLDRDALTALDGLRAALREAGAQGTRAGMTYGFGVHLNPSIASRDAEGITNPLLAYALIEPWMRETQPIDLSRRVLPFTDPYPTRLVAALCDAGLVSPEEAAEILETDLNGINAMLHEASEEISRQVATDILIIEDEPLIAMDIEEMVESLGHRVVGNARTHKQAVEMFAKTQPKMVLADIQLADGSSGLDAVNEILEAATVPVIFITAFPERLLTGERPEPTFLVTKPFSPEMVKALISQALFFDHQARAAA